MIIRLSLLQKYSGTGILSKDLLRLNGFRTTVKILHRNCSDIKRNEELLFSSHAAGVVIPSALKIKQTIKSGFYDLVDGFTSIQTSCPTCPSKTDDQTSDDKKIHDKCLFINKTTGNSFNLFGNIKQY